MLGDEERIEIEVLVVEPFQMPFGLGVAQATSLLVGEGLPLTQVIPVMDGFQQAIDLAMPTEGVTPDGHAIARVETGRFRHGPFQILKRGTFLSAIGESDQEPAEHSWEKVAAIESLVLDPAFHLSRSHRLAPRFSPIGIGVYMPGVMAQAAGVVTQGRFNLVEETGDEPRHGVFVLSRIRTALQSVERDLAKSCLVHDLGQTIRECVLQGQIREKRLVGIIP